ncbi:PQQ-binding-like beta-propeller repeat protein [Cellulomonas sp. URHE0023]|uniref:outer membrane protein assembly factor BamB family protein n=1 Tax=Cellulomonas sp. URHE0023 TaxID=1380354 RepID=UPI00048223E0|nr:PQQ-binding-like beta-propeller repeat protein [Cellulomonas sp. URHE0023]
MARGEMQHVELDEESAGVVAPRSPTTRRRRRWVAAAAGAALAVLAVQLVADARERAVVARLAEVPGVLAPVDESLPVAWRSDSVGDLIWYQIATHGAVVGPVVDADGSQRLVAHDLATGKVRWSTELYGPDPVRAEAEADLGASPPTCVTTDDAEDPDRVACLATDGFVRFRDSGAMQVPASATFVRVVDTADGRVVAQWPASGTTLAVVGDVAVLASYSDSYGAVILDARDLLTGEPRWTAQVAAPTEVVADRTTDWPPDVYRVADLLACTGFSGHPALIDADGQPVNPQLGDAADADVPGHFYVENATGRLVFSDWSNGSSYGTGATVLDGDRPRYTLPGTPYVPTVDDGSVNDLLLFSAWGAGPTDGVLLNGADAETGTRRWSSDLEVSTDNPAAMILRGRAFVTTREGLAAVDGRSGRTLWSLDAPEGRTFGSPMTDGRYVLVLSVGSDEGTASELHALDPGSGEQVWRRTLPSGVDFAYPIGDALLGIDVDGQGALREVVRLG